MLCKLLQQIQLRLFATPGIFFLNIFHLHLVVSIGAEPEDTQGQLPPFTSSNQVLFFFLKIPPLNSPIFFFSHCCDYVLFSPSPLNRLSLICWVNNDSFFKTLDLSNLSSQNPLVTDYHCFILVNGNVSSVGPIIMMQLWKQTYTHYTHTYTQTHTQMLSF